MIYSERHSQEGAGLRLWSPDWVQFFQGLGTSRCSFLIRGSPSPLINTPLLPDYKILFPLMPSPTTEQILTFAYSWDRGSESSRNLQVSGRGSEDPDVRHRYIQSKPRLKPLCHLRPGMFPCLRIVPSCPVLRSDSPAVAFWIFSLSWFRSSAIDTWTILTWEPSYILCLRCLTGPLSLPCCHSFLPLNPFSTLQLNDPSRISIMAPA